MRDEIALLRLVFSILISGYLVLSYFVPETS